MEPGFYWYRGEWDGMWKPVWILGGEFAHIFTSERIYGVEWLKTHGEFGAKLEPPK